MSIRLDRITIAVADMGRMARFYSTLFETEFSKVHLGEFEFRLGQVAGLQLHLCPKDLAGITATQNIHQLRFVVTDLDERIRLALSAGGQTIGDTSPQGGVRVACLRDPDGNSIEFLQE